MPTIPGMIPGAGLFMQSDRMMNSPNMPLSMYDPNQYVDPMQAIAYQQQLAQQLFQMQNPMLALPNNMGRALGGAIQNMMNQGKGDQQTAGANNTPEQQNPHDAYTAVKMAAHILQMQDPNMSQGEALYKGADLVNKTGQFEDTKSQAILQQAVEASQKKYGYNPMEARKLAQELAMAPSANFLNQNDGRRITAQQGTPEYQNLSSPNSGWVRTSDVPANAPYQTREYKKNGLYYTEILGPDGKPTHTFSSTQPIQYSLAASTNGTGTSPDPNFPGMPNYNPKAPVYTNDAADKITRETTNRAAAAQTAFDAVDTLDKLIRKNPGSIGLAGDYKEKFNEFVSTAKSLYGTATGQAVGLPGYNPDKAPIYPQILGFVQRGIIDGRDAVKFNAAMAHAAYAIEAAQGHENADPSTRKFNLEKIQNELLGDSTADPVAQLQVHQQVKADLLKSLNNVYDNNPNVKGLTRPNWLRKENAKMGVPPDTGWVHMKDAKGNTGWVNPEKNQFLPGPDSPQ